MLEIKINAAWDIQLAIVHEYTCLCITSAGPYPLLWFCRTCMMWAALFVCEFSVDCRLQWLSCVAFELLVNGSYVY